MLARLVNALAVASDEDGVDHRKGRKSLYMKPPAETAGKQRDGARHLRCVIAVPARRVAAACCLFRKLAYVERQRGSS